MTFDCVSLRLSESRGHWITLSYNLSVTEIRALNW